MDTRCMGMMPCACTPVHACQGQRSNHGGCVQPRFVLVVLGTDLDGHVCAASNEDAVERHHSCDGILMARKFREKDLPADPCHWVPELRIGDGGGWV